MITEPISSPALIRRRNGRATQTWPPRSRPAAASPIATNHQPGRCVHLVGRPLRVGLDQRVQRRAGRRPADRRWRRAGTARRPESPAGCWPGPARSVGVVTTSSFSAGSASPSAGCASAAAAISSRRLGDRLVVRPALGGRLQTADQEGVRRGGVGARAGRSGSVCTRTSCSASASARDSARACSAKQAPPDDREQEPDHQDADGQQLQPARRLARLRPGRRGRHRGRSAGGDGLLCRRRSRRCGRADSSIWLTVLLLALSRLEGLGRPARRRARRMRVRSCPFGRISPRIPWPDRPPGRRAAARGAASRVGSATSRSRQACRPMAASSRFRAKRALPNDRAARGGRQDRLEPPPGVVGDVVVGRRRHADEDRDAARRRCSRRTRSWYGTGWPAPGSGR